MEEKIIEIIKDKLEFTNGWKITDEAYDMRCKIIASEVVKLFAIPEVVGQSEQLEAAWKALEWVGFTKGEEFDDDDIKELLGF